MKNKRIFALLLSIAIMLPIFPAVVWADKTEVYTEFTGGNNTGSGTQDSPYNLFEDALAAVADGGTIYIGAGGAYVNDENDGKPLEITKNVTIVRAPGITSRPVLETRKGGLVLGANVTFSNIVMSFSNANHAAILANGYTLTLDNVSYSPSARTIQLAGGSLYDKYGSSLSPMAGENSKIVISGKDTGFGNIYAGSINGSFDKRVDIEINGVSGSAIGNIYASGAKEGYYNSENFLDPYNEPEAPVADASLYPVTGTVSVNLDNGSIRSIDGKTGGGSNALLSISTTYSYSCNLNNIGSLNVMQGTVAPDTLNTDVNISLQSGGALDMSSISDCTVENFNSDNGILILDEEGCMTINGLFAGTAEFRTFGGLSDTSGIAVYDHLYIKTSGDGVFNFNPYPTQSDMKLYKTDDGWRTGVQSETSPPVLTAFDIDAAPLVVTKSRINSLGGQKLAVTASYTEDTYYEDIGMIPLEYTVTYNGETIGPIKSTGVDRYDGYYECNIAEFNMNFEPIEDTIFVSNGDMGEIAAGIYDITITAPTESGNVTRSVRMTVIEDEPAVEATAEPTAEPTLEPTAEPTAEPTVKPTVKPALEPTAEPTVEPTAGPTIEPTVEPTVEPTAEPTTKPAVEPTVEPTVKTTLEPTAEPTVEPTVEPTTEPTSKPTVEPTTEPTVKKEWAVNGIETGKLEVTFTNLTGKDISNAVMLIAAYDEDGALQKLEKAEESVNAAMKDEQNFSFDLSGVRYSEIKIFIWDSLEQMMPVCGNYNSWERILH